MSGWEGLDPCPCGTAKAPELHLGGVFRFTCPACGMAAEAGTLPEAKQAWNLHVANWEAMRAELHQRLED